MGREFKVKLDHAKSLSYWFWTREAISYVNAVVWIAATDYFNEWPQYSWEDRAYQFILYALAIPFAYITVFTVGTYFRKLEALKSAKEGHRIDIYNKNNIAYFEILTALTKDY